VDHNRTILIAEDDENYAMLMKRALQQTGRTDTVHQVPNGREAIDYLVGKGKYADREAFPFPGVLFLDLKMPGLGGFDVLRWMQENPACRVTPTLVLSSSVLERDVELSYALGAHAYLGKPATVTELKRMLGDAYSFWAWCAKPPVKC
jgi:two-component system, response regulator